MSVQRRRMMRESIVILVAVACFLALGALFFVGTAVLTALWGKW